MRSSVYFKFYTNTIKVTYFFENLFGIHDSQHCGASEAPSYAFPRYRYGCLHLHVQVVVGFGWRVGVIGAATPGRKGQGIAKCAAKIF